MQSRRLGQTDIYVSPIGLGTVKFGRNQGVKYPAAFDLPSDQQIVDLLSAAQDLGVNLLDTAPAYGFSEERLGKALLGQRHRWVLSTKVGEEFVNGESQFDFSASAIQSSVDRSLQRLKTDYLDVVLVHSNGEDVRLIEEEHVFSTLAALKKSGKIRAFGMSTKTIAGGMLTVDLADVAMVTYNSTCTDDREIILHAEQKRKGIFIKKALASGLLSSKEALHFALSVPGVTSVILGTINLAHLKENCQTLLDAEKMAI